MLLTVKGIRPENLKINCVINTGAQLKQERVPRESSQMLFSHRNYEMES